MVKDRKVKTSQPDRRKYNREEKKAALADVPKLGVTEAAHKHKIPVGCVSRWWHEAKKEAERGAPIEPRGAREATRRWASRSQKRRHVAKAYTPSQRAEILEYAAAHGPSAASEKFGVSRFAIHDWEKKTARAAAGRGPNPTSGRSTAEVEKQRDQAILQEWRQHPGLGPSQIRNQLRRKNAKASVGTVRDVMTDHGYRPPKVKRELHDQTYQAVRPNHLWHWDYVHRYIHRTDTHTLILIDDCSRFVVGHGVDDTERAKMVIRTFEEAVERHGRPERVMHDKGSAFWSWKGISRFTQLLTEMGIDQVVAEHKEWNGKIEVFNGNLHKELFDVRRYYDIGEMRRRLSFHWDWYNHARTHHALGGLLVPADRYYGRADQVLARIEAGAGRELGDGLELRDRCLELFKVVSRAGVAEIWLLGHRLFAGQPTPARDAITPCPKGKADP
ncbi:DDE-type integrase/transposase/recombinase [Myxococcota bacterium]